MWLKALPRDLLLITKGTLMRTAVMRNKYCYIGMSDTDRLPG